MDRLLTMTVFRRVAELQSFSAAARDLGLSNAAVSKHVAVLEDRLRARLLQRTTRRVSTTPAGEAYLARCARILDELAELDAAVTSSTTAVVGTLRANVPSAFGLLYVAPVLAGLARAWPDLAIDLSFSDRFVDLVEEGVDVVLRIASTLPDSTTLVAQRLAGCDVTLCATPRYLKTHGTPRTAAELAGHACIAYGHATEWRFARAGAEVRVPLDARVRLDNSLAIRDAVLGDAGIALLPAFYVDADVRAKRLRAVLPDHVAPRVWIHAVYPRQRHLSTKIRVFVEAVRARLVIERWAIPVPTRVPSR